MTGRGLLAKEQIPDHPAVVVVGCAAWQMSFAGDRIVTLRTVHIDRVKHALRHLAEGP